MSVRRISQNMVVLALLLGQMGEGYALSLHNPFLDPSAFLSTIVNTGDEWGSGLTVYGAIASAYGTGLMPVVKMNNKDGMFVENILLKKYIHTYRIISLPIKECLTVFKTMNWLS